MAPNTPEARARERIDQRLLEAGWMVQNRPDMNLGAGPGVAVREFETDAGPADYLLFVEERAVGVIEAKKSGRTLGSVEAQTRAYAKSPPRWLRAPVVPLPFLYESTDTETWFTNGLDPEPQARRIFSFHRPETLGKWIDGEIERAEGRPDATPAPTLKGRMRCAPRLERAGMWPAQITAVENLEASIQLGKPRALIQMATGGGKTFAAITALYRLIKHGGARRALFLVDRGNLGRQALKEFQAYCPADDPRKFPEIYNVVRLANNQIDPTNKVVITTIQRLYSILKGEVALDESQEEGSGFDGHGGSLVREPPPVVYSREVPPEFFDVVVVDECHRSIYTLWRQVLEYFDATIVGLTATPAKHTYAFFHKNVVSEYRHEQAVRDRVNVPFEVYEIRTRITEQGARIEPGPDVVVGRRNRRTRAVRWETVDEEIVYGPEQIDRTVESEDQLRTVVREFRDKLFADIFPGRRTIPKTLFFAKNDDHAEAALRIIRQEFGLANDEAVKVTYKPERHEVNAGKTAPSRRAEELIQAFRNSFNPRIAVTVDMIATGTDIKPLECVVFLRTVKSRGLFEQMRGRGVRVMPDADFQAVTPDASTKTHFVLVDCVGVCDSEKVDPPVIRDRGIAFEKLLEMVRAGNRDEDVLSTLAGRLDRMDRQLTESQRREVEEASAGVPLSMIVAGLLDAVDPDREDDKARELFGLPGETQPDEEQIRKAQQALRATAAKALAHNPALCNTLLSIRRQQEVLLDSYSIDEVTRSGRAAKQPEYPRDEELVSEFQRFLHENRDSIDALQILYDRPYGKRLTRDAARDLSMRIASPPRQWTEDALWKAYEKVEQNRVRGASTERQWTDIVSLARHALAPDGELVPFVDEVRARFDCWLLQQENLGRRFTPEQLGWLELIRDRIAADFEVRVEDFDDVPFVQRGGLGKVAELFGDGLEGLVAELNEELVA